MSTIVQLLLIVIILLSLNKARELKLTNGVAYEHLTTMNFIHNDIVINREIPILDFETELGHIFSEVVHLQNYGCNPIRDYYKQQTKVDYFLTGPIHYKDAAKSCEASGAYLPSLGDKHSASEFEELFEELGSGFPEKMFAGIIKDTQVRAYLFQGDKSPVRESSRYIEYYYINKDCRIEHRRTRYIDDETYKHDDGFAWYYNKNNTLTCANMHCKDMKIPLQPAVCLKHANHQNLEVTNALGVKCDTIAKTFMQQITSFMSKMRPMFEELQILLANNSQATNLNYGPADELFRAVREVYEDIPIEIPENNTRIIRMPDEFRPKRGGGAVLLTAGIVRTIAAIAGYRRLQSLHSRLDDQHIRLDQLNGTLLDYSNELSSVKESLAYLTDRVGNLESQLLGLIKLDTLSISLTRILNNILMHYEKVRKIVTSLVEKRATVDVLPLPDLLAIDSVLAHNMIKCRTTKDYTRIIAEFKTATTTHMSIRIIVPLWDLNDYEVYKIYALPDLHYQLRPKIEGDVAVLSHDKRQYSIITGSQLASCLAQGCERPPCYNSHNYHVVASHKLLENHLIFVIGSILLQEQYLKRPNLDFFMQYLIHIKFHYLATNL